MDTPTRLRVGKSLLAAGAAGALLCAVGRIVPALMRRLMRRMMHSMMSEMMRGEGEINLPET